MLNLEGPVRSLRYLVWEPEPEFVAGRSTRSRTRFNRRHRCDWMKGYTTSDSQSFKDWGGGNWRFRPGDITRTARTGDIITYHIPCMVENLAPNQTQFTRVLGKNVSRRGYFCAVPSKTWTNLQHPPPSHSLNDSSPEGPTIRRTTF